ncbi:hypothetical protein J5N97_010012 [Dioscorea zingiberensis]|uniref:Zinc-finger domain-containing protein n=1 Tax=Dioscorea zingiberensis TaxID=325984 RepID=A0A9D5CZD5_9LILI|nr:hypothetical protein J5N97_010012 [Dioscorea zingiberensis]
MVSRRRRGAHPLQGSSGGNENETVGLPYEKSRDERIKENLERMHSLGIVDLSLKLNSSCARTARKKATFPGNSGSSSKQRSDKAALSPAPRRSNRLQNLATVSYAEYPRKKVGNPEQNRLICIEEGSKEELYTDEHEKLLGSCEMSWTLFVDGYDQHGRRIYDQIKGETCHQCRQKTLGHHTHCSMCNLVQGQFCGDCLYMRYGENVLEVSKNPDWICPVCRGICNCSLCRKKKGWAPTGSLYKKVSYLGFKSVAHYLIQTRRSNTNSGVPSDATDQVSSEMPLSLAVVEEPIQVIPPTKYLLKELSGRSHSDNNEIKDGESADNHSVDNHAKEKAIEDVSIEGAGGCIGPRKYAVQVSLDCIASRTRKARARAADLTV